jgi:hypothetical protein
VVVQNNSPTFQEFLSPILVWAEVSENLAWTNLKLSMLLRIVLNEIAVNLWEGIPENHGRSQAVWTVLVADSLLQSSNLFQG